MQRQMLQTDWARLNGMVGGATLVLDLLASHRDESFSQFLSFIKQPFIGNINLKGPYRFNLVLSKNMLDSHKTHSVHYLG